MSSTQWFILIAVVMALGTPLSIRATNRQNDADSRATYKIQAMTFAGLSVVALACAVLSVIF